MRHVDGADAGDLAGILAEMRRARPLDGAGNAHAVHRVDGADQLLAHAAGSADDDQAHVAHRLLLTACPSAARDGDRRDLGVVDEAQPLVGLDAVEARIDAMRIGDQLPVRAFLDQPAVRQHDDVVGIDDRRKPVRDDDRGAVLHHLGERCLHARLGFVVERRGRLVEQQDRRVAHDGAGDRQALALAAGQRQPVLADRRVVAVRLLADELVGLRDLCAPARPRRRSRRGGRSGCCRGSCLRTDRAAARHRRSSRAATAWSPWRCPGRRWRWCRAPTS